MLSFKTVFSHSYFTAISKIWIKQCFVTADFTSQKTNKEQQPIVNLWSVDANGNDMQQITDSSGTEYMQDVLY